MSYQEAKAKYEALGVDVEAAMARLKDVPVAMHCWQGDDVRGFDQKSDGPLTGGIQTTGNYPGRATTPEELMADIDVVLSLCPGTKKINLHASYAIFDEENGGWVDRDKIEPKHFKKWVEFCKERGLGADFNPTFFSHPKCDPLTLASPCEETRKFWIEHGKACIRISQYLAEELGQPCIMNIWTGDGLKDIPADRISPRKLYRESIDEILSEPYDFNMVKPCVESKVFGIGVEAYTVGSSEFSLCYAAMNMDKCIPLMDNGHYHPTEMVSDKIPALLSFFPEIALHITRPMRWDSDHVVLLDDETKEICKEIVRCGGLDGAVKIATDYFDASINRVSAWTVGMRNVQKALLMALVTPHQMLADLQNQGNFTELMVRQEELKTMPFGEIWDEYCRRCGVAVEGEWFETVKAYERDVLSKRA
ncbi:MAG: L-rhamnose isomerase [bacterium]|nr:L-rhamnose isomerase [Clostridiales bacterium]MDD6142667.1 L-rhamnose isomerase [bacterium]